MKKRIVEVLELSLTYFEDVIEIVKETQTVENFSRDSNRRHAVCMCLISIGEVMNKLPHDFVERNSSSSIKQAIYMRNFLAHGYWDVDYNIIWETITIDIPELYAYIMDYIKKE